MDLSDEALMAIFSQLQGLFFDEFFSPQDSVSSHNLSQCLLETVIFDRLV
jgi:hypothetical protein